MHFIKSFTAITESSTFHSIPQCHYRSFSTFYTLLQLLSSSPSLPFIPRVLHCLGYWTPYLTERSWPPHILPTTLLPPLCPARKQHQYFASPGRHLSGTSTDRHIRHAAPFQTRWGNMWTIGCSEVLGCRKERGRGGEARKRRGGVSLFLSLTHRHTYTHTHTSSIEKSVHCLYRNNDWLDWSIAQPSVIYMLCISLSHNSSWPVKERFVIR